MLGVKITHPYSQLKKEGGTAQAESQRVQCALNQLQAPQTRPPGPAFKKWLNWSMSVFPRWVRLVAGVENPFPGGVTRPLDLMSRSPAGTGDWGFFPQNPPPPPRKEWGKKTQDNNMGRLFAGGGGGGGGGEGRGCLTRCVQQAMTNCTQPDRAPSRFSATTG